jgi:solute carrier family 25 phosphate transporter 3
MITKARFSPFFRLLSLTSLQLLALVTTNRTYGSSLSIVTFASADLGSQVASAASNLDYRYFLAGGVCAATSHGITTPIDVVKTRMQADPERYRQGVTSAALQIIKEDGPSALLGGLGPTVVGYGIEGAMKFGLYEVMKPVFGELLRQDREGLAFVLSSIVAGAIASIILCPLESTRIRIVTDPSYANKGLLVALPKLIREEGFLSTFSGVWAMLAKQVPYTTAKQVSFDILAEKFYAIIATVGAKAEDFKWIVSVDAAIFASIIACLLSQPGDVILTETYKRKTTKNIFMTVKDIYDNQGGTSGFFTGTSARILHVGVIITSQLVIYDIVKQLLGLPATGSN